LSPGYKSKNKIFFHFLEATVDSKLQPTEIEIETKETTATNVDHKLDSKGSNKDGNKMDTKVAIKNSDNKQIKSDKQRIQVIDRNEVHGVIIVAPGGEVVNAGISYADDSRRSEETEDEVVYRLYESLLPFLFYTHKLSKEVQLEFEQHAKNIKG
jgi:hypothetical protein